MFFKKKIKRIIEPIFNCRNKGYLDKYYSSLKTNENIYNIENDIKNMKKILIIAPHQDDETIGLGGTISKLSSLKIKIDLVYLTDGRIINDESNISDIRKKEANELKKIFKLNYVDFVNNRNDTLYNNLEYTVHYLKNNINLEEYDACFLTSTFDCHKDHRASFDIIKTLCKENQFRESIIFYMYDINNSIQGKILNCISILDDKELSDKWKAYNIFKSQEYITFSTLKIMDVKRLRLLKGNQINGKGLEYFARLNKKQFLKVSDINNEFAKDMKTATSSIKLVKFLEYNKKFAINFENIEL